MQNWSYPDRILCFGSWESSWIAFANVLETQWFLSLFVRRRQRALKPSQSPYRALLETLELSDSRLTLQLINDNNKVCFMLSFMWDLWKQYFLT